MKQRVFTFEGIPLDAVDLSKVLSVEDDGSFTVTALEGETGREAFLRVVSGLSIEKSESN